MWQLDISDMKTVQCDYKIQGLVLEIDIYTEMRIIKVKEVIKALKNRNVQLRGFYLPGLWEELSVKEVCEPGSSF